MPMGPTIPVRASFRKLLGCSRDAFELKRVSYVSQELFDAC